jgi:hypothetical protein
MSPTPKKFKRRNNAPLPRPNVEFATASDAGDMTPEKVRGMVCNPIYTGIGPFETIIEESEWIQSALTMIASEGADQFLVNMLYVLRKSFGTDEIESDRA